MKSKKPSLKIQKQLYIDLCGFPADYMTLNSLINKENIRSKFIPKTAFEKKNLQAAGNIILQLID